MPENDGRGGGGQEKSGDLRGVAVVVAVGLGGGGRLVSEMGG